MRTAGEEHARWTAEWATHARDACWGCPGMTWEEGIERDLAQIVPHLRFLPGGSGLDLGCGPGRLTLPIAAAWPDVTVIGVDIAETVIDAATAVAPANATFLIGDGRTIPLPDETVDAAWSMLLFQHLEADAVRGYLSEVARVLRLGGMFRFQWCTGSTNSPYAHDYLWEDLTPWCNEVGLYRISPVEHDPDWPTWRWVTVEQKRPRG